MPQVVQKDEPPQYQAPKFMVGKRIKLKNKLDSKISMKMKGGSGVSSVNALDQPQKKPLKNPVQEVIREPTVKSTAKPNAIPEPANLDTFLSLESKEVLPVIKASQSATTTAINEIPVPSLSSISLPSELPPLPPPPGKQKPVAKPTETRAPTGVGLKGIAVASPVSHLSEEELADRALLGIDIDDVPLPVVAPPMGPSMAPLYKGDQKPTTMSSSSASVLYNTFYNTSDSQQKTSTSTSKNPSHAMTDLSKICLPP